MELRRLRFGDEGNDVVSLGGDEIVLIFDVAEEGATPSIRRMIINLVINNCLELSNR